MHDHVPTMQVETNSLPRYIVELHARLCKCEACMRIYTQSGRGVVTRKKECTDREFEYDP